MAETSNQAWWNQKVLGWNSAGFQHFLWISFSLKALALIAQPAGNALLAHSSEKNLSSAVLITPEDGCQSILRMLKKIIYFTTEQSLSS